MTILSSYRSPVPLMSKSKLSMLSSSTIHLDMDESNSTQQTTVDDITQSKDTPEDSTHLEKSYENTTASSAFREELLSHFERRLSDLGPRSKYPYLQRIVDQKHSNSGTISPESTSQSEEVLTRLPKEKKRGTWWKYYANSRAARTRQQRGEPDRSATDDVTEEQAENSTFAYH